MKGAGEVQAPPEVVTFRGADRVRVEVRDDGGALSVLDLGAEQPVDVAGVRAGDARALIESNCEEQTMNENDVFQGQNGGPGAA